MIPTGMDRARGVFVRRNIVASGMIVCAVVVIGLGRTVASASQGANVPGTTTTTLSSVGTHGSGPVLSKGGSGAASGASSVARGFSRLSPDGTVSIPSAVPEGNRSTGAVRAPMTPMEVSPNQAASAPPLPEPVGTAGVSTGSNGRASGSSQGPTSDTSLPPGPLK